MQKVTLTPVVLDHNGLHSWKPFLLFFAVCPPSVHMWLGLLLHAEHLVRFCWIASWDIWPLGNGWGIRVKSELSGGSLRASGWKEADPVNTTVHLMFVKFARALTSNCARRLAPKEGRESFTIRTKMLTRHKNFIWSWNLILCSVGYQRSGLTILQTGVSANSDKQRSVLYILTPSLHCITY